MNTIKIKGMLVADMLVPVTSQYSCVLALFNLTDFFVFIEDTEKLGEIRKIITDIPN